MSNSQEDNKTSIIQYISNHPIYIIIGMIGTAIGIWQFIITPINQKRSFDEKFNTIFSSKQSQFLTSTNFLLTVLPQNIKPTRDYQHWRNFSDNWEKHSEIMEEFYDPLSNGVVAGNMRGGKMAEEVCNNINAITNSHYYMAHKLKQVRGISVAQSGTSSSVTSMFGPVVHVPNIPFMELLFKNVCNQNIEEIKSNFERVDPKILIGNQILDIVERINRHKKMLSVDIDKALEEKCMEFGQVYRRYLMSQGVPAFDATNDAYAIIEEMLSGKGGNHWLVPGLNDIEDEVQQLLTDRDTDHAAQIKALEKKLDELKKKEKSI